MRTTWVAVAAVASLAVPALTAAGSPTSNGQPQPPKVTNLSRHAGSTLGASKLVIDGAGLRGTKAVWFGGRRTTALRVVSDRRVVVTTPAHPAGRFQVRVVTPAGKSRATTRSRFDYRAPLVVLDPGHNGANASHPREINRLVPMGYGRKKPCNTTGTATNGGYPEHAFNWNAALRVRKILRGHFIHVLMTRPNDHGVGPCVNIRAKIESTKGVAAAVAIHADGAPASGHGFHVNEDSRRPVGASRRTVRKSTALGTALHDALAHSSGLTPSNYIGNHGYVRRDDLAGLNLSTNPTSFLELGNMRNAHDARLQTSARGRQRIARAVAAGLLAYLRREQ